MRKTQNQRMSLPLLHRKLMEANKQFNWHNNRWRSFSFQDDSYSFELQRDEAVCKCHIITSCPKPFSSCYRYD